MILSGSTNGRNIKVVATTPGTTLHTAVAGTTSLDEIYLFAVNTDTVARTLTVEFGGTTSPNDKIVVSLEPNTGLVLVVPGLLLQNGLVVRAFASAANVIMINGYVHRIGTV